MMEILVAIGVLSLMLCVTVVLVLPICLAIWVAPVWLWLYAVYVFLVCLFACIIAGSNADRQSERMRKPGDMQ
mgnify:CR=1 FL=1